MLSEQQIVGILQGDLTDPFSVFGMHREEKGISVRAFLPGASRVEVCDRGTGRALDAMEPVHPDGVFVAVFPRRKRFFKYELAIRWEDATTAIIVDPYSFLPVMSEESRYLYNQGNNQRVYEDLGGHLREIDGVPGTVFALWAPDARRVSVVGDFNTWDGRRHPMRRLGSSGVWELFMPGLGEGTVYKYEIKKGPGSHLVLKTDPCGYCQESFPNHGTVVCDLDRYEWHDIDWMKQRASLDLLGRPMSIYEVHLGSWRRCGPGDGDCNYLSYTDLARALAAYVKKMGFTHVELMPIQEHPYLPSWGYQVGGFYAVNHRFGSPRDFQAFVDYLHGEGIGVIADWVCAHFPRDEYGLAGFDGTCLYEHEDPREGQHQDWGTLIFNFGRHEVRNFLTSNALFWLDKFHLDGLRFDAVASMLYRNYSRKDGEWLPNEYGGVENLEAVEFLQSVNHIVHTNYPGVVTFAEESTAWPLVSRPTFVGGLGFTYKWNMGWMHDVLDYFSKDPVHRKYHHDQITFGLWYAFTENFVLVLSHDEVVHGKRSLLEKMPGDTWRKFANLRCLYGFMYGHPGKKLLFQGGEFGMHSEWCEERSIDWHVLECEDDSSHHQGLQRLLADLNRLYRVESALWERDFHPDGFEWIDHRDRDNCVVSFVRHAGSSDDRLLFVCNFTPVVRYEYRIGVPCDGFYEEVINTDAREYGGSGRGNSGGVNSSQPGWHGLPWCLRLTLPPLAVLILKRRSTIPLRGA